MKSVSLYEFGGLETVLQEIQTRFLKFFTNCSPVLDIGCGRGIFLELLRTAGIEGVGVDHAQESLDFCKEKGLSVYCEPANSFLAQHQGQFGGIFCSHVIEHMGYEDASKLLELCHAALRPEGRLVLVTPNPEDLSVMSETFWLDPTHVRPYPKVLIESMMQACGFKVIVAEQFLGSLRLVGRRRLPVYFWRRLLLGRYYGLPNTLVVASKNPASVETTTRTTHCPNR